MKVEGHDIHDALRPLMGDPVDDAARVLGKLPRGIAERGYHLYQDRKVAKITWTGEDLEAELTSPTSTVRISDVGKSAASNSPASSVKPISRARSLTACLPLCLPRTSWESRTPTSSGFMIS